MPGGLASRGWGQAPVYTVSETVLNKNNISPCIMYG